MSVTAVDDADPVADPSADPSAEPVAADDTAIEEEPQAGPKPHADDEPQAPRRRRRSTSHLKDVPDTLSLRESIREAAEAYVQPLDTSQPWNKDELEHHSRQLLDQVGQPERFLGFAMVLLGNAFWRRQFLATPFDRRLLLLPHCLKHADGCPADYDEFGLDCETCGACSIADYKGQAEKLGYKVLVAEGSPVVLRIIVEGYVDGILGVACLNVLEKAIDKVLLAGVPSYAVPLHSGNCRNTTLDQSWVWEVLDKYEPLESAATRSYVPLMRTAGSLLDDQLDTIVPPQPAAGTPLGFTHDAARNWLATGGKRSRPFMTLAAYQAVMQPDAINGPGAATIDVPPPVAKAAVAIEAFHKASLVHDDIQDDDLFRYGEPTLHRTHGVGPAINVGDHLIGLGYRLIAGTIGEVEPAVTADLTAIMADAHLKLCEGQGAEMRWNQLHAEPGSDSVMTPVDALKLYALKTSPAFEAALLTGLRLAGPIDDYREPIAQFAKQLGIGFQILNDLADVQGEEAGKVVAGQDLAASRPTVLVSLAEAAADESQRATLASGRPDAIADVLAATGAIEKAESLVAKSKARAEAIADEIAPESLRALLYFLVDTVLAHAEPAAETDTPPQLVPLQML